MPKKENNIKDSNIIENVNFEDDDEFKEETTEEKIMKLEISEVENTQLWRVFNLLIGPSQEKSVEKAKSKLKSFGYDDIKRVLKKLGITDINQNEIDLMIWEVDENLDKRVDSYEFELMYKKCIEDKTNLEPKNLFNLVQYLMFCKPIEDDHGKVHDIYDFNPVITNEDTYFLIYAKLDRQCEKEGYIRNKREELDKETNIIFG